MNIKAASEKTGLTKKAIKYYESEGLISPMKNNENSYREYSDEHILRLNLIGTLRTMDVPIAEIRALLEGAKSFQRVMNDTLKRISETISNLERSRDIISNIVDKKLSDYSNIGEEVTKLRKIFEPSMEEKDELVSEKLLRIFPGAFGEMLVNIYEPFLNINIDSDEKKEAWINLVEILDDIDETDVDIPFLKNINNISKIEDYEQNLKYNMMDFLKDDITKKENYAEEIDSFVKSIIEDEKFREKLYKAHTGSTKMFNKIGVSFLDHGDSSNNFDECLVTLNEDYRKLMEIREKMNKDINEAMKNKLGLSFDEFLKIY